MRREDSTPEDAAIARLQELAVAERRELDTETDRIRRRYELRRRTLVAALRREAA